MVEARSAGGRRARRSGRSESTLVVVGEGIVSERSMREEVDGRKIRWRGGVVDEGEGGLEGLIGEMVMMRVLIVLGRSS